MSSLDRIAALLAKAERTDNPVEAEAYLAKAQALATQASVDLAVARARVAKREARQSPISRTVTVGERAKRANKHMVSLFLSIARVNDTVCDIAHDSTYVIAYGMPSDLDVIEAMFGSLATQMTASANAFLATGQWRGESYVVRELTVLGPVSHRKPHTAQTARAAFYQAFISRITARLKEAREQVVEQVAEQAVEVAVDVDASGSTTGALVLRKKEAEVRSFHRATSRARGSWSGYSGAVRGSAGSATTAGREAASRARLTSPRGLPGSGGAIGG